MAQARKWSAPCRDRYQQTTQPQLVIEHPRYGRTMSLQEEFGNYFRHAEAIGDKVLLAMNLPQKLIISADQCKQSESANSN